MESVKVRKSVSACELSRKTGKECANLCGMCPSCVFAPKPPGSTGSLWKASDKFKRTFLVKLLLRCRSVEVLERIQSSLCVTSWTVFNYGRCRFSAPPRDRPSSCPHRQPDGKPVDMNEIWNWFDSSPDWLKSSYLCRMFCLCEAELLRLIANLTDVLLVRLKRGFLQFNGSRNISGQNDEDSEDPALMVVPGSSASMSGVSLYRDFISCLPVQLSKRILGLLEEETLKCCKMVSRYWQHLAQQTMEDMEFGRSFQREVQAMKKIRNNLVSPTYANIVDILVPMNDDDPEDVHSTEQKEKPFETAYAKVKTKTLQMEERNVYCCAYYTKVLLGKEDPHRVLDYRGGSLMATGSKDRLVNLFYVGTETITVAAMRGHIGSVRAVLLCEDRDLVITGSYDASIRCWNIKTDRCEMVLYGHSNTINCLDFHADRLVSGAKDHLVKVWNLRTGKQFEDFNFKHVCSVQCVKISKTTVYSSCARGLVKIWNMENASLLRVITAHRSSVKCLFFDEWHLLSGDLSGKVTAWSTNCDAKDCLMTFNHPGAVKSLTLVYLRVVTGCVDGKIRIFNFLTGDCLREITAETETGRILSLRFNDNTILVNSTTSVKLYQFAKVFWDYADSAPGDRGDVVTQDGLASEKSAALLRRFPFTSVGANESAQAPSPNQKIHYFNSMKTKRAEPLHQTCFPNKCQTKAKVPCETVKPSVMLSEKAARERMKKRGPHHPMTRDCLLLRINAMQKAQCMDEVGINMERNARLRDSWGPHTTQDPFEQNLCTLQHMDNVGHRRVKFCIPTMNRSVGQNMMSRNVSTAPATTRRHHPPMQPHSANTHRPMRTVDGFFKSATVVPQTPDYIRSLSNPKRGVKTSRSLP